MAASAPPTVGRYRPCDDPVKPGATADQVMLSPVTDVRETARRRRRRVGWLLVLSLSMLLLAALAAGAAAQPGTSPTPPPPGASTPLPEACHTNALPYCFPSSAPAQPTTGSPTATATPNTCASVPPDQPRPADCIPQPSTPAPSSGPGQPGVEGESDESDCGISDICACFTEAINTMFRGLVEAALSPILDLLGRTALSTPTIDSLPGIGELWNNSFGLVIAAYGLFVLIGGIVVMGHESVQTRYSIKEIGARIPVAFLASTLSLFFVDKLIQLANALTLGVLGDGVGAPSLGDSLSEAMAGIQSGGLFIILTGLVLVVVGIGLLIVYVVRVVVTLILIVSGPLFLMCHALPHTEPLARWWWKAVTAVLGIQVAQALVLITAVRTFLSGGVHLFGSTLSAFGMLIAAIALFYILFKIPFWLLSVVKVSSGRSLIGGLARAYIAAKTFGMIAGNSAASGTVGTATAARGGGTGSGGGGSTGPAHPLRPTRPRIAPTSETIRRRLQQAYDAERVRAARRSRLPSQAPRFLQPTPQQTTHDPAITPATPGPTRAEFSSAPTAATSPPQPSRSGPRTVAAPQFRAPAAPHRSSSQQAARPVRVASVPPHLQFTPPVSPSAHQPHPVKPSTSTAGAPVFRQAHPEPRIGDARPRTPAVPPIAFRAPKPPPSQGGDKTP